MRRSPSFEEMLKAPQSPDPEARPGSPLGSPPGSPSRPQQEQITTEEVVFGSTNLTLYHFNPSKLDSLSINQRKLDARYEDNVTKAKKKRLMFEELSTDASKAKDSFDDRETLVLPGDTVNLYRFVILRNGRMVCGQNYQDEAYSHENLADGDGVFAAGEFGFNTSGSLRYVSNRTGHYCVPPKVLSTIVLPCLEAHDCTVEDLEQLYVRFCSSGAPEGSEPAQSFVDYKNSLSSEPARHKALQKSFRLAKEAAAQKAAAQANDRRVPVWNACPFRQGDTNGARGFSLFADLSSGQPLIGQSSASSDIQKRKREDGSSDENHEGVTSKGKVKHLRGGDSSTARKVREEALSFDSISVRVEDAGQRRDSFSSGENQSPSNWDNPATFASP